MRLDAQKSWVTSAGRAASYVWSSRPLAAEGPMTLWLVPGDAPGLSQPGGFDGLGLRGNGSTPVTADGVLVPESAMLGPDGGGLDLALTVVLPWFLVLSAAFSVGPDGGGDGRDGGPPAGHALHPRPGSRWPSSRCSGGTSPACGW